MSNEGDKVGDCCFLKLSRKLSLAWWRLNRAQRTHRQRFRGLSEGLGPEADTHWVNDNRQEEVTYLGCREDESPQVGWDQEGPCGHLACQLSLSRMGTTKSH